VPAPLIRVGVFLATLAVLLLLAGVFGWLGTYEFLVVVAVAVVLTVVGTRQIGRATDR
jgi:membrane protein implicated in regulation of membrane protease activity